MWTAFGIMLGYVMDLAFYHVPDKPHITGLNWRLMLASVCTNMSSICDITSNIRSLGWGTCFVYHGSSLFLSGIPSLVNI